MSKNPSPQALAAVFGIVGLLCLWTGATNFISARKATDWPVAEGTILKAALEEVSDAESSKLIPHLLYEYRVAGKRYVSSRITFAQRAFDNDTWSKDLVRRYPIGSKVKIHYDPVEPNEAAIFVGVTYHGYAQPIFGLVLLIATAMICKNKLKRAEAK
jgi:hypothetical protein